MAVLLVFAVADWFAFVLDDHNDLLSEEFVSCFGDGAYDATIHHLLACCSAGQVFDPQCRCDVNWVDVMVNCDIGDTAMVF